MSRISHIKPRGLRHLCPEDFAFGASLFVLTATTSSFVKKCYKDVVCFKNVSHISYIYTAWRGHTSEFVFFSQFHPILMLLIPCLVHWYILSYPLAGDTLWYFTSAVCARACVCVCVCVCVNCVSVKNPYIKGTSNILTSSTVLSQ
jgi:hypothetical protein